MSKRKPSIDEDEMRRILGNEGPLLDAPSTIYEGEPENSETGNAPNAEARRKRMAIPDFEETFLIPCDIRNRSALYVSGDTKRKILEIARRLGTDRMTATSYVENILRHHLSLYKEEINRLYQERNTDTLL